MSSYALQRELFRHIKSSSAPSESAAFALTESEAAALDAGDLRALALQGVHPVLLNAFARLIGKSRDDYRELLIGTGSATQEVKPRWRAS
ncbi:hypothetical protein ACIGW8_07405 [Streptomyces sioyaensis]|uniref:hypothetical protein n=1 Tax=Streptomyces sioyaensis TaxID=67364 RepID=UPI0037D7E357